MTIKRLILGVLTILVFVQVSFSLLDSWNQPQIQSRLELYQTNLVLNAAEWNGLSPGTDVPEASSANLTAARNALLGEDPYKAAQQQYQEARETAQKTLENTEKQLQLLKSQAITPPAAPAEPKPQIPPVAQTSELSPEARLQISISKLQQLINELELRIGVLQAHQGKTQEAIKTWTDLVERAETERFSRSQIKPAKILIGLWSEPPRIPMDAQQQLRQSLDSWFRDRALTQVYTLERQSEALQALQTEQQERAEQAIFKLAIVAVLPLLGVLTGIGLLVFVLVQLLLQGKNALLAQNSDNRWTTPWDAETIWQVFVVGFFFVGQFVLPLLFQLLPLNPASLDSRMKAAYLLTTYLLLSGGSLGVLYLSIRSFRPLPEGWFRFNWKSNWILWGLGGYFAALPLVIVVSLINQQLWKGQGGSNPILPIALEGRDGVALAIFFLTAAVAAPLFEELLFRGFLLPSLTRDMPVWAAIVASSILFAVAHLNLSEVLPLAVLGMVLGIVYTRSRNLLAPMLLHSLWNSGTLLSLYILGSGAN